MDDISVGIDISTLSKNPTDKNTDVKLTAIAIDNMGAAKGGATVNEIATEIVKKMVPQIVKAALKTGVNNAIENKKKNIL